MKLRISDFQSINRAELEIKGFSTLWGKNNLGKSAICRAISSVLYGGNPKNFVRKGAKFSEVEISDSDFSLLWRKGEKVNQMEINGQLYDKIGKDIPKPVADLGFREVEIDNKVLNPQYAEQFSPLFILNDSGSGSTLATILTEISRLGRINTAITLVARDEKRDNATLGMKLEALDVTSGNLKRIEEGLLALGDIDQTLLTAEAFVAEMESVEDLQQAREDLQDLIGQLNSYAQIKKAKFPDLKSTEKEVANLGRLTVLREEMVQVDSILTHKNLPKFVPLSEKPVLEFSAFAKLVESFNEAHLELKNGTEKLQTLKMHMQAVLQERQKLQKEYPVCPICEKPW